MPACTLSWSFPSSLLAFSHTSAIEYSALAGTRSTPPTPYPQPRPVLPIVCWHLKEAQSSLRSHWMVSLPWNFQEALRVRCFSGH